MGFFTKVKERILGGDNMDYRELIKNGAIVVDVRSEAEFKSGHIDGSQNYPISNFTQFIPKMKNKTVILVCLSGGRAGNAKSMLEKNGVECYNAGGWQNLK